MYTTNGLFIERIFHIYQKWFGSLNNIFQIGNLIDSIERLNSLLKNGKKKRNFLPRMKTYEVFE